jgi:hypothetical protein
LKDLGDKLKPKKNDTAPKEPASPTSPAAPKKAVKKTMA